MDPISYGVAAKQKQRIEKVIAEPDSDSGIVTTPSTIAVGETITIPAGRTAVLPNTTVNGTLVVDGEVFIPSGSSYTATNINVSGVGSRITGDFSNANNASKTAVQTSTLNNGTVIPILPNGTGTKSGIDMFSNIDTANTRVLRLFTDNTESRIESTAFNVATVPMTFFTGGVERMRIDTLGNVGIGTVNTGLQSEQLHIANSTAPKFMLTNTIGYSWSILVPTNNGELKFKYEQGSITPLTIDRNGNVLFNNGTFGYGTGAGGTVTQTINKGNTVTLNKPYGQIITNSASIAAGGYTYFTLSNSLITANDAVLVELSSTSGLSDPSYYEISSFYVGAGSVRIKMKNVSGGALAESLAINFAIIKGAIS